MLSLSFDELEHLKQSLKRARSTLESFEEKFSQLKDEVVATFVLHFEKEKRKDVFLYPDLDLKFWYQI